MCFSMKVDLKIPTMEHHTDLDDPKLSNTAYRILRNITKETSP